MTGTTCGYVTNLDVTNTEPTSGEVVEHLTGLAPVCAMPGDSGGPVFANHVALGIVSKGNPFGDCGEELLYAEVTEADDSLQVHVSETRLTGPPWALTGCARLSDPCTHAAGVTAELMGEVDANGSPTSFDFSYGTTSSYGNATPSATAGSQWNPQVVSQTVGGLRPATVYHYRATAENSNGHSYGMDQTFKTPTVAPIVEGLEAPGPKAGTVALRGRINPGGLQSKYHFEWGTTSFTVGPQPDAELPPSTLPESVSLPIAGLKGDTTYHLNVRATNIDGEGHAETQFTTPDWHPHVESQWISDMRAGNVILHSSINPEGFDTQYHFNWGTSQSYGNTAPEGGDPDIGAGEAPVSVQQAIGVKGETYYDFRTRASNEEGSSDDGTRPAANVQFTTPDWRPIVTDAPASAVKTNRATLTGTVNPNGFSTEYYFEYGLTPEYGNRIPWAPMNQLPSTEVAEPVGAVAVGLQPDTTYHYRLIATNREGSHVTPDREFTTRRPSTLCRLGGGGGCATGLQYPAGTAVTARLVPGSKAVFKTTGLSVECSGSEIVGHVSREVGNPIAIEPLESQFTGCLAFGLPVVVSMRNPPYTGRISYHGSGNGDLLLANARPAGVEIVHTYLKQTCVYGISPLSMQLEGGAPAHLVAAASMVKESGVSEYCGGEIGSTFTARYEAVSPDPVYAEAAPNAVLCSVSGSPCPLGAKYSGSVAVEAHLSSGSKAVFQGQHGNIECSASTVSGEVVAEEAGVLPIQVRSLSFSECGGATLGSAVNLPYVASLERTEGARGTVGITGDVAGGHPVVRFQNCSEGIPCAVGALELNAELQGGDPAQLVLESVGLPLGEANNELSESPSLSATYTLTTPQPLFVAASH